MAECLILCRCNKKSLSSYHWNHDMGMNIVSNASNHLVSVHVPKQLITILIMHKHIFEIYSKNIYKNPRT
jgi:hypothetical protein